jgi:hypothetical protein
MNLLHVQNRPYCSPAVDNTFLLPFIAGGEGDVFFETAEVVFIYHIQVRRLLSLAVDRMVEDVALLRTVCAHI